MKNLPKTHRHPRSGTETAIWELFKLTNSVNYSGFRGSRKFVPIILSAARIGPCQGVRGALRWACFRGTHRPDGEDIVRKTAVLLVVGALVLAFAGGAASAQEGGQAAPTGEPLPPPPSDYAYVKGEIYKEGDLMIGYREFVEDFEGFWDERGDQGQARSVLERCVEADSPGLRIPVEVSREIQRDARQGALPETGDAPVMVLLCGLLLAGAGLGALLRAGAKEGPY